MTISITRAASFTTSDNAVFSTREAAMAHEKFLVRRNRLIDAKLVKAETEEGALSAINFIAAHADALIELLTVKQTRGRKSAAE
jgi:hypothetical protein